MRQLLLTRTRSFYEIVATAVETLYDHNITADLLVADELFSQRLKLHLRLQNWKAVMPRIWSPCVPTELQRKSSDEIESMWPRALLAIHYNRALLLINRPAIILSLKSWVFDDSNRPSVSDDATVPVLRSDFSAARELVGVVRGLVHFNDRVLQRHAMWFPANYSGKISI